MWVDKPDASTLRLIECVFPEGLKEEEYLPLLFVLTDEMTLRAAGNFAAQIRGKSIPSDYAKEYNDCLAVRGSKKPDMEIVEDLRRRLKECGWYDWLDEDTSSDKS